MRCTDLVRVVVVTGLVVLQTGCASHRGTNCPHPARVIGVNSRDNAHGGWVIVRETESAEDTAARVAAAYHVRTRTLLYLHGFSTYPVPQEPKFLCEKGIVEVHYAPGGVAAR